MLWARSNPNPKLKEEKERKMMGDEEDLELKDTEMDDEVNGDGNEG